jgi:hypothetical protein
VCTNMNGGENSIFRTFQGLREGDPLSPILFNLVAGTLSSLMTRTVEKGMLRGVVSHLIPGGITHIQYADDTILMIDGEESSILYMKFVLYCFEWLFGLKINYHKSEAYNFGMDDEESRSIANKLNCQLGVLHMKYLGIPMDSCKLIMASFAGVVDKVAKRVPP